MGDRTAPKSQLRLEWVYGYRGHQVRTNLFYNQFNELCYFVAGVGIVFNLKEHKQRFFLGHDDDIISLTLHPDKVQVATGQVGKSPQILVWSSKTLETTSILKGGHTDGVGIIAFDGSGERLASCGIDQDSTIVIWDWKKGKILAKSSGHQERVFDLQFNPFKENGLVSCGVKHISFWTLIGNTLQKKKGIFGQTKDMQTMFCLGFSKEKDIYYTGTMNGQIYVWKENNLKEIFSNAHSGSIFCLIRYEDGFITGGKDSKIRVWDDSFQLKQMIDAQDLLSSHDAAEHVDNGVVIRSINYKDGSIIVGTQSSEMLQINLNRPSEIVCVGNGHAEGELWSLATSPADPDIFATASDDKTVRIWSIKTNRLLKVTQLEHKIRSCSFSADGKSLACGLSEGTLVVLKLDGMSKIFTQKYRNEVLHEMKYSPCGNYLAVGSNDNFVDIFKVPDYKRVGVCQGNSSFITHLDWSKDSAYIQTNSGDGQRLIFKCPGGKHITNSEELKKIQWQTFTGVLGGEVVGIWEKYTDKTDINATDAYFEQQCIVTGDDFGLVKLFRFPSLKKGAKFRKYVGHSSHVTNVRFTRDKSRVISIGGADHAIFQWRFLTEELVDAVESSSADPGLRSSIIKDNLPDQYKAYMDSNSEESDSEASGREVDSDVENEKQISYDRSVYKEDLKILKPKIQEEIKKAESTLRIKRQPRPEVSLNLDFVFGYRGYDCRDNLFFIHDTGEMVYHVAALGIVYNKETHSQKFYNQHSDDILSLCLHPIKKFVATGQIGRDPPIHVWDIDTMRTLSILKGEHYRGVCSLNFSSDGKKLASVGLDDNHMICVWDWRKGEKLATTRGHKDKIFCIKWNPHGTEKLVTVGVKHIKFWNQVGGGFTSSRGLFGNLSGVENMMCVTFGKSAETCYTGGNTGSVYVWVDQKLTKIIKAHTGPIFAIYAHDEWQAYVTGGKDGCIMLWDSEFALMHKYSLNKASLSKSSKGFLISDQPSVRAICLASKRILIGTKNAEIIEIDKDGIMNIVTQGHGEGELWGLSLHPTKQECCTVSDDKTLRIWNLEAKQMVNGKLLDKLGRSCEYSPNGKLIAVGYKEGQISVLKADTLEIIETVNHRKQEISDLKFSPVTGKYLAVGSHEDTVDIYNVDTKKRVGICKGASSYITHVEWDVEGRLVMINSGASEILYFETPRGNRVNIRSEDVAKISWNTFTSVLGPTCEGIWPPCTDVTDVNTSCLTKDGKILATGDDFGQVKLFEYPCTGKFSKFKRYNGHSSHVTRVRWNFNDSKLLSAGGNDTSLMIWTNLGYVDDKKSEAGSRHSSSMRPTDILQRNAQNIGQSDESDTDSEDEGYDSDVIREYTMDYTKSIFINEVKRPTLDEVKSMYEKVNDEDKIESAKPSRMVKTKFKRTKINRMKGVEGTSVDPLTLIRFMAKLTTAGDEVAPSDEPLMNEPVRVKTEIKGLKLSHIHGYRGFDCRDNLFYINDGAAVVYHTAAAGIVLDLSTSNQSFYLEHTDDIISLCVNDNPKFKNIVATGQIGANPVIHVWNAMTKETLSILSGLYKNNTGICSVAFSSSGKMLVSVGLDQAYTIGVWRWKEGALVASASGDRHPNRIFRAVFRPDSDSVFVSVGFKHVRFWNVAGSELLYKKGMLTDWNSTKTKLKKMPTMLSVAFGQDNVTYTGSMIGDVFIWKDNVQIRAVLGAHSGPIFSMYTSLFDGSIVTGAKEKSKDGNPVKLWDKDMKNVIKNFHVNPADHDEVVRSVCRIKNKILIGTKMNDIYELTEKTGSVQNLMIGHGEGELWGLSVHPTKEIFATASYDGYLKIWDVKSKKLILKYETNKEVRSVDFNPDGSLLAIGTKDGEVIVLKSGDNYKSLTRCDSNRQRNACITDVHFSPRNNYIAAGSSDSAVDFFEVTSDLKLSRIGYCLQVPGPVMSMDWATTADYIKVGTSNYRTVYYKVPKGNEVKESEIHDKVEWNQWTSVFGAEVIGIWPVDNTKNFINCAHLASHANKLATGDDDGVIKLFKFPCLEKDSPCEKYYGHSSNITNVRFLNNDTHLITIGGEDLSIFVWECF